MIYQIIVQGSLDPSWSDWFDEMKVINETYSASDSLTIFEGALADQASLRGILNHLWDLNLTLISVKRIESQVWSE